MAYTIKNSIPVIFLFAVWLFSSCEPVPVEVPPGNPADYKYAGTWAGNTSQQKIVSFTIDTLNKWAQVIRYEIVYKTDSNDLIRIYNDIHGISKLNDGRFSIELNNIEKITGAFAGDTLLTGTIHVSTTGGKKEPVEVSFFAVRDGYQPNMYSKCMTSFEIEGAPFNLEQDLSYYFPFSDNGITNPAIFIMASFCHYNGTLEGQRIITIKKGSFFDSSNLITFFSPGNYPYSQLAENGIEILYYPPEDRYRPWSTSYGDANQDSSSFSIIDTLFVHEFSNETMIKFQAEFNCNLYKKSGEKYRLTNGKFLGYARYIRD